jgi:hypothetical protein
METIDDHPEVVIKWLETTEGMRWSRAHHVPISDGILLSVKVDSPEEFEGWGVSVDNEIMDAYLWFCQYDAAL